MPYLVKMHPTLDLLVDNLGRVFVPQSKNRPAHWTLGTQDKYGYLVVGFNRKKYFVHRLVAETFLTNAYNKPTVDHIDRNKRNNAVTNLRWATLSEQQLNQSRTEKALSMYGVRAIDDAAAYARAKYWYKKAHAV